MPQVQLELPPCSSSLHHTCSSTTSCRRVIGHTENCHWWVHCTWKSWAPASSLSIGILLCTGIWNAKADWGRNPSYPLQHAGEILLCNEWGLHWGLPPLKTTLNCCSAECAVLEIQSVHKGRRRKKKIITELLRDLAGASKEAANMLWALDVNPK